MNHTATPFYLAAIVDRRIAGDAGVKYQLVGANSTVATIYRSTDASFIVRACNAHDELVGALKLSIPAMEYFHAIHGGSEAAKIYQALSRMRAALAKVQAPEQARAA